MKLQINLPDKFIQKLSYFAEQEGYGTVEEFIAELSRQYIRGMGNVDVTPELVTPESPTGRIPLTPEMEEALKQSLNPQPIQPPVQEEQSLIKPIEFPVDDFPTDNPHEHAEVEADISVPIPVVTPPLIRKKKSPR